MPGPKKSEGRKDDTGKLRMSLIPPMPLKKLAEVYTIGEKKYDAHNWRKGIKYSRILDAMKRHMAAWEEGEITDPIDGQHHLASVAWGAFALIQYELDHPEMDDRYQS